MKIPSRFPVTVLILFFNFCISFYTPSFSQATFVVNSLLNTADNNLADGICNDGAGNCTLRAAIQQANALVGRDSIAFNIAGTGPFIFQPPTSYPSISESIVLDASTQPGHTFSNPQIVLDGSLILTGAFGFYLQPGTDNSVIRGFCIGGFLKGTIPAGYGIRIFSNNNLIEQNFVGIAADGLTPFPNESGGIFLGATIGNTIGGNLDENANVISGNTASVGINVIGGFNNVIQGNLIGTDKSGSVAVPNTFGIAILTATNSFHTIGSTQSRQRNIISGNSRDGIFVTGGDNFEILGNYIGTDSTGIVAVPNEEYGIHFESPSNGIEQVNIGGVSSGSGNLISGNGISGIRLVGISNLIAGNLIGTQIDGISALGNGEAGVHIEGENNIIGSVAANIIAHNAQEGVRVETSSFPAIQNLISQNSIYNNGTLGIDLGYNSAAQGQTVNDNDDPDSGPNLLQNFADVLLPAYNDITNILNLTYSVSSDPANVSYPLTVEFFIADANGQGRTFIGLDTYTIGDYTAGPEKSISFTPLFPLVVGEGLANTVTSADNNTSEFNSETILPIAHTFLAANLQDGKPILEWNSLPDSYQTYDLERRASENNFSPIQTFQFGNSKTQSYTDLEAFPGINKYRLRITYLDGSIGYSNIASVLIEGEPTLLNIYPNPAKERIFIEIPHNVKAAKLKFFDVYGRLVTQHKVEQVGSIIEFDISDLSKGVYWLRVNGINSLKGGKFVVE